MNYRDIIRGVREGRDNTQARIGEVLNKSQNRSRAIAILNPEEPSSKLTI